MGRRQHALRKTESQDSFCEVPSTVDVWTIKEGFSACAAVSEIPLETGKTGETPCDHGQCGLEGRFEANSLGIMESAVRVRCFGCESAASQAAARMSACPFMSLYVDAPNIYLYPEQPTATHVRIANPQDDFERSPVPAHQRWSIAHPDGQLLTKQGWKDYLFYELVGWASFSAKRRLRLNAQLSIESAMAQYGFNGSEIQDFSDFWDSEFPVTQDYTIYPQTEKLRRLSISPEPDSFLRVWFLVEDGCNAKLKSPEIQTFEPVGFYATEWGVMFSGGLEGPKLWVTGL